jgi:outer membrane immunogenic protein
MARSNIGNERVQDMLRHAAAIAASVLAITAPAQAADMYSAPPMGGGYKDAYIPAPMPMWSGFYVGLNGGYGYGAKKASVFAYAEDITVAPGEADAVAANFGRSGSFGGGQIGFNLQRSNFLFGIETDFEGANIRGRRSATAIADGGDIFTPSVTEATALASSRLDYFGTVRGRLGFVVDRALVYLTGGLAYGHVRDTLAIAYSDTGATFDVTTVGAGKKEGTRTGYVLGGGVEYALTPAWSLKAEYQYMDLGKITLSDAEELTSTSFAATSYSISHTYHTARLGLNYRIQQEYAPLR